MRLLGPSGIRTRLVGLVVIPCVGILGLGLHQVDAHRQAARGASQLAVDVESAVVALDALVATTQEFRHSEKIVRAREFGQPVEVLETLLGYDIEDALAAARRSVDANPLVPALVDRAGLDEDLHDARSALDATATKQPLHMALVLEARDAWRAELTALLEPSGTADIPRDPEVTGALASLRAVAELFELDDQRVILAMDTMVPGSSEPLVIGTGLPDIQARYADTARRVVGLADEHLRRGVEEIVSNRAFEDALPTVLAAGDGPVDVTSLVTSFRSSLEHSERVQRLVSAASEDARRHALAVGDEAQRRADRTVLALLALSVISLVVAVAVAASISRPLRRVARRAAQISGGDLDGDLLPETGPQETAVLAGTLNETVVNLRAVAARMAALAAGDLERARRATPGELGALVGRSVDGLADSLAERERLQQRLAHDADHDGLTGLANRRTAIRHLDALLDAGSEVSLLYLDLDGVKGVNDEFGHGAGDRVLIVVARRLEGLVAADALVARIGGDEFVIGGVTHGEAAELALAEQVMEALLAPIRIDGLPHRIGVSIGIAHSTPGDDADVLLRWADSALYEAKNRGRGHIAVLDADMRARIDEQNRTEIELREAIAGGALELHYQPQFDTNGELHGVEALVRWPRRDGTTADAEDFVPLAERGGLVVDLDRWVLRRALEQLAAWHDAGPFPGRLSINVSTQTMLGAGFVDDVRDALAASGADPGALVVEITETTLLHDLDTAVEHIGQLRAMGVRSSVDDFGTGYTSLSHLRQLAVSEVKIDRSFVQAMGLDERDRVLVDLVTRIGTVLGLDVVAEGVETAEQLGALRSLGCHYAQGFFLGRPVPPAELVACHASGDLTGTRAGAATDVTVNPLTPVADR